MKQDIEKLLVWVYRDELPKQESSPYSQWLSVLNFSLLGTRISRTDYEHRLPAILGPPHPDAVQVAKAAEELPKPSGPLVIHHAIMGTRPDWLPQPISVHPVRDGSRVRIVGKCEGKNRYSIGSYCPLQWKPSQAEVDHARGEYSAWHAGLVELVRTLQLAEHIATGPAAAPTPWIEEAPRHTIWRLDRLRAGAPAFLWVGR